MTVIANQARRPTFYLKIYKYIYWINLSAIFKIKPIAHDNLIGLFMYTIDFIVLVSASISDRKRIHHLALENNRTQIFEKNKIKCLLLLLLILHYTTAILVHQTSAHSVL